MPALHDETHCGRQLIARLNAVTPLTRDAEIALFRAYKAGNRAAADRILEANLRHVGAVALRYRFYGVPLPELLAQGALAQLIALDRFDPERGVRFATYASHWVRAEMLAFVLRNRCMVGGGRGPLRSRYVFRLRREHRSLMSRLGERGAVLAELAQRFGRTPDEIAEILARIESRDASLDARSSGGDDDATGASLLDVLPSAEGLSEEALDRDQRRAVLRDALGQAMASLNARERFIVERRVTADDDERMSLVEIGKRFGVSRERARQLESAALGKLRKTLAPLTAA
jgi:RNA polymerase sigma-32 factor